MKKICIITTMWTSINNWIKPFLNEYNRRGIDVTIVCNMDSAYEAELKEQYPFVHTHPIAFPRGINATESIKSIALLYRFMKKEKFDLVQYSTPNASLYASVAAKLANVPVRLYCQWGMVYVTMSGIKKSIFRGIENLVCHLSTCVQPDSQGNLLFCRAQGFYDETKSYVIWNGSAKGLDLSAFDVSKKEEYADEIRKANNITVDTPVIGFVGRLGKEKGCNELFRAFQKIKLEIPDAKLLFVGPIEKEDTIDSDLLGYFFSCEDIIKTDRVSHVEKYTSAMDVFVLPSYREGFGMSVIEASAMEIPVVVTRYPGPSSAMKEGITGFAVDVENVDDLVKYITFLLKNPDEAKKMGIAGRKFVEDNFDQRVFIKKYMDDREKLINMQ